jgi:hypothetical protein
MFTKPKAWLILSVFMIGLMLCLPGPVRAAEQTVSHDYAPIEWSFQGNDVPETYWTPYLPLVEQHLLRFKIGFRFSTGTIAIKSPVRLTYKYDPATAQAGGDVPIKIKAELLSANYNTFQSAFGMNLPNEIQLGFLGITGVPDFLPWYTLPWDICGLLGAIPGIPDAASQKIRFACQFIDNLGVNMETKNALPLASAAEYHDKKVLMEFKLTDIFTQEEKQQFLNGLGISIFNKLSSKLGPDKMDVMLNLIMWSKNLNEAGATEFLTDKCITAAGVFAGFAKISAIGDPYFKVEGVEMIVNLRMYIPGGKGSGTYPLVFTSPGEEKTVTFRDITPFVVTGDKLTVVADSITFKFKLKQGLTPKIQISAFPEIPIPQSEKYVSLVSAKKDYTESEYKLEVPLSPSTALVQGLRVNTGCTAAVVNWASPLKEMKGTVKVFDGGQLIKTVSENSFKIAHNVVVTGLTKSKNYVYRVENETAEGGLVPGGEVSGVTKDQCSSYQQNVSVDGKTMTNVTVTPGMNYADISWDTNVPASTEVIFSPSQELTAASVAAIRKQEGVIQGWGTRGGERVLETSHSLRILDLEPGTQYYYLVRSHLFENNDPTKRNLNSLGALGQITTLAAPERPSVRVQVASGQINNAKAVDLPVQVTKSGSASPVTYVTDANGLTPWIPVEGDASYTVEVKNHPCYKDASTSFGPIPPTVTGQWGTVTLALLAKDPPGAYVYDSQDHPVSGATVSFAGKQATTNASGYYSFGTYISQTSGNATISKPGLITKTVPVTASRCGCAPAMSIGNAVLNSGVATVNITVKKNTGALASAQVAVKQGNSQLGNMLTTNSQGKASLTWDFQENTQAHQLTVVVTPPAAANLQASSTEVAITGGAQQDVEIFCIPNPPADTQGPVISDVTLTQVLPNKIDFVFKVNEPIYSAGWELQKPSGQVFSPSMFITANLTGSLAAGYGYYVIQSDLPPGAYKVKIKAKDLAGNEGQSPFIDFNVFGGGLWAPKITGSSANSLTVSWTKYPRTAGFGKYVLTLKPAGQTPAVTEIADINTTTYTFSNLIPGVFYPIFITAKSAAGEPLTQEWSVGTSTPNAPKPPAQAQTQPPAKPPEVPPVISGMTLSVEKARIGQDVTVSAKITDDVSVEKVELWLVSDSAKQLLQEKKAGTKTVVFSHTFKPANAGKHWVRLYAYDASGKTLVEKDLLVEEAPAGAMTEGQEIPKEEAVKAVEDKEKPAEGAFLLAEEKRTVVAKPKTKPQLKPVVAKEELLETRPANDVKTAEPAVKAAVRSEPEAAGKAGTAEEALPEATVIKFSGKPSKVDVNEEFSLKVAVQTQKAKKVLAVCAVDWGDGAKQEVEAGVSVKHIYREAGKYKLNVAATLKDSGAFIPPAAVSADIKAEVQPPKLTLTKTIAKSGAPGYDFKIKAAEGSYPVGKWTLDFGDGKGESGEGVVARSISHVFPGDGDYKVGFSATDKNGNVSNKSLSVKIVPKKLPAKN